MIKILTNPNIRWKHAARHFSSCECSFVVKFTSPNGKERLGEINTPHGAISTPNFVFCATKAAMKTMTPLQLREANSQIILSNTYHLMLTPGADVIESLGGLQKMTGWNGPMLTDSGGYQIFSMGHGSISQEIKGNRNCEELGWVKTLQSIDENCATFKSYIDGTVHHLSPEKSIQIQRQLGADLIVVFDECTPFNVDKEYTEKSMQRSHRWALRCLKEFERTKEVRYGGLIRKQGLYAVIQGGVYKDLRDESIEFANKHPFFGIAIGGCLGSNTKDMHDIVGYTRSKIRNDRPIHLLGIGRMKDIFHGVRHGIDTFDCVHPTRIARHGGALVKACHWSEQSHEVSHVSSPQYVATLAKVEKRRLQIVVHYQALCRRASHLQQPMPPRPAELAVSVDDIVKEKMAQQSKARTKQLKQHKVVTEHVNLKKASHRCDARPIDAHCTCYTCQNFSRGYIYHLFKAKETLAGTLVTIHNVHFMNKMMADIREGIRSDTLDAVEREYLHPDLQDNDNNPNILDDEIITAHATKAQRQQQTSTSASRGDTVTATTGDHKP